MDLHKPHPGQPPFPSTFILLHSPFPIQCSLNSPLTREKSDLFRANRGTLSWTSIQAPSGPWRPFSVSSIGTVLPFATVQLSPFLTVEMKQCMGFRALPTGRRQQQRRRFLNKPDIVRIVATLSFVLPDKKRSAFACLERLYPRKACTVSCTTECAKLVLFAVPRHGHWLPAVRGDLCERRTVKHCQPGCNAKDWTDVDKSLSSPELLPLFSRL